MQGMVVNGCSHRLDAGAPWCKAIITEVAAVPRPGQQRQSAALPSTRVSPDASREFARAKNTKIEKALEVMGDEGPAVEALRAEQGCGEATSNQRRGVHSEVRETHSRVGCGTLRRGSRSQGAHPASVPETSSDVQRLQALVALLQCRLVQVQHQ